MEITQSLSLLGGLSPRQFMKRHWQKKPLLVRGALPSFGPLLSRSELFALAAQDHVESRLVAHADGHWTFRPGPFGRRALPPLARPNWTLLVQGVNLHHAAAHDLLAQFRFVPQARLDDLMISYATNGGSVGPHFDSYDVFLLQAQGRRRWRIGRQQDLSLRSDVPLKILARFRPEEEYVLEAGDMLYLPPGYAHHGIAQGECQTYSIGFRAPGRGELARGLLQRLADEGEAMDEAVYRDPSQEAVSMCGAVPLELQRFARDAVQAALKNPQTMNRVLGQYLTEPKANVWFEARVANRGALREVVLDRRTSMMYDRQHIFINGESYRVRGRDAALLRALADARSLGGSALARASQAALSWLRSWCEAGWIHPKKEKR